MKQIPASPRVASATAHRNPSNRVNFNFKCRKAILALAILACLGLAPAANSSSNKIEVTLGAPTPKNWYIAGVMGDNDDSLWGDDDNYGLTPDKPKRTLTGPKGVFASGFNPEEDHIFVVRPISATAEASARTLAYNYVVIRYPNTDFDFTDASIPITYANGASKPVILHRYPGGHAMSNEANDLLGNNGPFANNGPLFISDDASHSVYLFDIDFDGMSDYDGTSGNPGDPHNPQSLPIAPTSALLSVNSGTILNLRDGCELHNNENSLTQSVSGKDQTIGGGAYVEGELNCTYTVFVNNAGYNGGGAYVATGGYLYMGLCEVGSIELDEGNAATQHGGGIYNTGTLTLAEIKCLNNIAEGNGGGIYTTTGGKLTNCSIGDSDADGNQATLGGGIYVAGGTLSLKVHNNICGNIANENGGGIYNATGATVECCATFADSDDDANISQNKAEAGNGGGVYNAGTLNLGRINYIGSLLGPSNSWFLFMLNSAKYGGAIYNTGTGIIGKAQFGGENGSDRNTASKDGGGLYNADGSLRIDDECRFFGNSATNGNGGGIYNNATLELSSTLFGYVTAPNNAPYANVAKNGGAIYNNAGSLSMKNRGVRCNFNYASHDGGAIYNNAGSLLSMNNNFRCDFNYASHDGGGIYINDGVVSCSGGEIIKNKAGNRGGGIYKKGTLEVRSSVRIYQNKANLSGNDVEENVYIPAESADEQSILINGSLGNLGLKAHIGVTKTKKWNGTPDYGDINADGSLTAADDGDHIYQDDDHFKQVRTPIAKVKSSNTSEVWAMEASDYNVFFDDKNNYKVWSMEYANSSDNTKKYSDQICYFIETWRNYAATDFAGGQGIESDPYRVTTAEQLAYLAKDVNGPITYSADDTYSHSSFCAGWFVQDKDIDLKSHYWEPIGMSMDNYADSTAFFGVYDGRGHTIYNTFSILPVKTMGLFGVVVNGEVRNTFSLNCNLNLTRTSNAYGYDLDGGWYFNLERHTSAMGGITGRLISTEVSFWSPYNPDDLVRQKARLYRCEAQGVLKQHNAGVGHYLLSQSQPDAIIGGLVGGVIRSSNQGGQEKNTTDDPFPPSPIFNRYSEIANCFAVTEITGINAYVGGLVGWSSSINGWFQDPGGSAMLSGGGSNTDVVNSYSKATMTVTGSNSYVGSLVGKVDYIATDDGIAHPKIENCYTHNVEERLIGSIDDRVTPINLYAPEGYSQGESYVRTYAPTIGADQLGYMWADNKVTGTDSTLFEKLNYGAEKLNMENEGDDIFAAGTQLGDVTEWTSGLRKYDRWVRPALAYYYDNGGATAIRKPINGDLPVLAMDNYGGSSNSVGLGGFRALSNAADTSYNRTKDGYFQYSGAPLADGYALQYSGPLRDGQGNQPSFGDHSEIDGMFFRSAGDDCHFIYGDVVNEPTETITTADRISIYEHAAIRRSGTLGSFEHTHVSITFDNVSDSIGFSTDQINGLSPQKMPRDWHMLSTPLVNAPLGFDYVINGVDHNTQTYGGGDFGNYWHSYWASPNDDMKFLNGGAAGNIRYWMAGWANSQAPRNDVLPVLSDSPSNTSVHAWVDGYFPSAVENAVTGFDAENGGQGCISGTGNTVSDELNRYPYGMDFYCWDEPNYHYVNFKRNGPNHWHSDEPHLHLDYTPEAATNNSGAFGLNVNETTLLTGKGYFASIAEKTLLQSSGQLVGNATPPTPPTPTGVTAYRVGIANTAWGTGDPEPTQTGKDGSNPVTITNSIEDEMFADFDVKRAEDYYHISYLNDLKVYHDGEYKDVSGIYYVYFIRDEMFGEEEIKTASFDNFHVSNFWAAYNNGGLIDEVYTNAQYIDYISQYEESLARDVICDWYSSCSLGSESYSYTGTGKSLELKKLLINSNEVKVMHDGKEGVLCVGDIADWNCQGYDDEGDSKSYPMHLFMVYDPTPSGSKQSETESRAYTPFTKEISVTHTAEAMFCNGWNLVGNPFHGYLNFDTFSQDNSGVLKNPQYVVYNAVKSDGNQDFGVVDFNGHNGSFGNGFCYYVSGGSSGGYYASKYLHPHQGFFIEMDPTASGAIVFSENQLANRHTTGEMPLRGETDKFEEERPAYPLVNLFLSSQKGCMDVCVVEFNRPEMGGAEKLRELRSGNGVFYANNDGENYAAIFSTPDMERIPIKFESKEASGDTYTISWNTANGDFSKLYLVDNITGVNYDMLANDSYSFFGKTDHYWSRFYITYEVLDVDENLDDDEDENSTSAVTFAFYDGSQWVVTGGGNLQMIDLQGRILHSTNLGNGGQTRVSLPRVATGMYLLRLTNDKGTQVQKIIIG